MRLHGRQKGVVAYCLQGDGLGDRISGLGSFLEGSGFRIHRGRGLCKLRPNPELVNSNKYTLNFKPIVLKLRNLKPRL